MIFKKFLAASAALSVLTAINCPAPQRMLTVSPSVTSNTYPGVITLNIAGLTNGESVVVQRWIDLNANGAVDPGEPLMDTVKITDNNPSKAIIGGLTNLNIPIDSNAATGAITATLNFPAAMTLENITVHIVYQLVRPGDRFAPVTATFVVTNATLPQSVSGTVFGGDGVTPLPYAIVVAQDQQKNNPVGGAVADGNGHYFLTLPVSSYNLIAALPNYYFNQKLAPSVILANGMSATNNLSLTNGTATMSGAIYDTANSNGLPGMLFTLTSGKWFAIGFTDTNGNYSVAVAPSSWTLQPSKQRMARRGYVLPTAAIVQGNATAGNATNVNFPLPRGTALFYGRIMDNSNNAYANIEVDGSASTNYDAKGYSDQNGYYSVAVIGDNTNQWNCGVDSGKNSQLSSFILNQFNSLALTSGQTIQQNFLALPATATISGRVQSNTGTNVVGVGLQAYANIGGDYYQSLTGTTDNSGNYSLAVAGGQWSVQFFTGNFSDALDFNGYEDLTGPHSVSIPPTNAILNIIVYPIGTPLLTKPQRLSATQFGFTLNGAANVSYTVQVATNLARTNWTSLFSLQLTNTAEVLTDPAATNSPRFYRILKN